VETAWRQNDEVEWADDAQALPALLRPASALGGAGADKTALDISEPLPRKHLEYQSSDQSNTSIQSPGLKTIRLVRSLDRERIHEMVETAMGATVGRSIADAG
jgi:hypothetical protein